MSERIEYQDFEVNIDRAEDGSYKVSINSQGARMEAHFSDPFTGDKRALFRQTLTSAVLRNSAKVRSSSTAEVKTMKELGHALFDNVVRDDVKDFYYRCLGQASNQGKGLRIRLSLDPSISDLPWEFLCTAQKEFLALDPATPVVRYVELPTPVSPLKVELPLRVLVVIASPKDLITLDATAEKARIAAALQPLEQQGLMRVSYLEGADTWPRLIDALRPNETHILHFIGHGAFDETSKEGVLAMENEEGNTRYIGSDLIRVLLRGKSRLRLAVLNSCQGAQAVESEPLSSVAIAMVRAGIPAVIAMQFEVSDNAAQTIAGAFYKSLALNFPVDAALTEARRQIHLMQPDSLEWATPVLYMQVPDGQLYDITSKQPALQQQLDGGAKTGEGVTTGQMKSILETLYLRGEQAYAAQNWDEALKCYRSVAVQNPDYKNVAARIPEIEAIQSGKNPPSRPAGQPEFDLNARAAELYKAGEEAAASGDWEVAIRNFNGVRMLSPNFRDVEKQLAYCERRFQCVKLYAEAQQLYEQQRYDDVLEKLRQIRSIDPRWVDSADLQVLGECGVAYRQAIAALKKGEKERGAELMRNIIAKRPDFEDVIARLDNLASGGDGLFGESLKQAGAASSWAQPLRQPAVPPSGMAAINPQAQPTPPEAATPPQPKPSPADQRMYEVPEPITTQLADAVQKWFFSGGYQAQIIENPPTVLVQGKKEDTFRTLLGMSLVATAIFEQNDNLLKVSVGGGKWVDKAAVAAFGMFVAFGFTVITAGIGAAKQKELENVLWRYVEHLITTHGGRRIG